MIITGDLDANVGTKTREEGFKNMGTFRIGKRNFREYGIFDFAEEHKLSITNTVFKKPRTIDTGLESHQIKSQET